MLPTLICASAPWLMYRGAHIRLDLLRMLTGRGLNRAMEVAVAVVGTAAITGTILFIIIGASTFAQILAFSGTANGLISAVRDSTLSPGMVLALMMIVLLVLGCFVDQVSMMLMTLPFFMPLVVHYGWDPLWFGVMYLICMQLGLLTPPFGMLLFTMRSVAPPSVRTPDIFVAVAPFVIFGLVMLGLVVVFPGLATWLPGLLLGR